MNHHPRLLSIQHTSAKYRRRASGTTTRVSYVRIRAELKESYEQLALSCLMEMPSWCIPGRYEIVTKDLKFNLPNNGEGEWWRYFKVVPLFVRNDLSVLNQAHSEERGIIKPCQVILSSLSEGAGGFVLMSFTVPIIRKSVGNMLKNQNGTVHSDSFLVPKCHFDLMKYMFGIEFEVTPHRIIYEIKDTMLLVDLLGSDWFYAAFKFGKSSRQKLFPTFTKNSPLWKPIPKGETFLVLNDLITNEPLSNAHTKRKKNKDPINPSCISVKVSEEVSFWNQLPCNAWLTIVWFLTEEPRNRKQVRKNLLIFESFSTAVRSAFTGESSLAWKSFYERLWKIPLDLTNIDRFGSWRAAVHHHLSANFNSWVWVQEARITYSFHTQKMKFELCKRRFGEKNNEL